MHVYAANLTDIGNSSFSLSIEGQVKKTGIFPAHLYFLEPVEIYWNSAPPNMRELHLGSMSLDYIGAAAGHARLKQATTFYLRDEEGFAEFAKYLISEEEFTWQLRCGSIHAKAFSFFPAYKNLKFKKNVIFKGINGFSDVKVLDFQLPGDDPRGGITTQVLTQLGNPSPFGIQLGTLNLGLYYKDMFLGQVQANDVNITTGLNSILIAGQLIPHTNNSTELDMLGELFTGYINGEAVPVEARGISTALANGKTVTWLSEGIKALVVQVPLQAPTPINPIKGISIGYLSLIYSQQQPYNPVAFSQALQGTIGLPFGFSLDIVSLSNSISLIYQGGTVGDINAAYSNSTTHLDVISPRETTGKVDITLPQSQLVLPNDTNAARQQLIRFQNGAVYGDSVEVQLQGSAKAVTDTPLGRVLLNGIKFGVESGLRGLVGLTRYPTIINTVDVTGGVSDALTLTVGTTIVNPSNLNLSVGDTTFLLENEVALGNVTLPNLDLAVGRVDVNATSFFDPNRDPKGSETLNRFISGLDTQLNISGFSGSSAIESLAVSLKDIRLNATLPGLPVQLVQSANLTVLDSTGITDSIANSIVSLANPFSSGLTITKISANATSKGIYIANIDQSLNFAALGKATTQSPVIPLSLNLYPSDIFGLLRGLVVQSGQDPAPLDGVVALGGYAYTPTTAANGNTPTVQRRSLSDEGDSFVLEGDDAMVQVLFGVGKNPGALADTLRVRDNLDELEDDVEVAKRAVVYEDHEQLARRVEPGAAAKRDNLYTNFNLPSYVLKAFSVATLDLTIVSEAKIGDYATSLTFSQKDVPLGTDDSLNKLLPVLASPIVQKIVDNSVLNIDRVTILDPQQESFMVALQGTLTNAGPFDATVSFPQGLSIYWNGQLLVQTAFPNIVLKGDAGAAINVKVEARVPDVGYLTTFTRVLLTEPSFVWSIKGEGLSVAAIGITVPNITISKDVQLTGLNGLKGMVIINSFDLPSNNAAGGITLNAQSTINNPSQVGVQLSTFSTTITRNDSTIGPAAATTEFTLAALAVTNLPLTGRLQQQTESAGLAALSEIFTRFVHDQPTDVVVHGQNAGPPSVSWLNDGIKALAVTVTLPSQKFDVIRVVSINQLSLFFTTSTAWNPPTSSSDTTANFYLPFAFPVDITTTGGPFIAKYGNQDAAVLNIPFTTKATTNVEARIIKLLFSNVPFSVYDNAHSTFSQFLTDTTAGSQVEFNLHGSATVMANTAAGAVTISDIPFDLNTRLLGLQNLNAKPAIVSDLDVARGYPTYLLITVKVALFNPSAITIGAGDVRFALLFQDKPIGIAIIQSLILVPGTNIVSTQINYSPQGAENVRAGQALLDNYVQNITSSTIVAGTQQTTDIASLVQALSGIRLSADIPSLGKLIVTQARLVVPKNIAKNGIASASVLIANPFTASLNILKLNALANYFGPSDYGTITLGTINQDLTSNPLRNPGHTNTMSREIPINLNIDPKNLIHFILTAARNSGTDLGPFSAFLSQIFSLSDTSTSVSPYPYDTAPPCTSGTQFDILGAILKLLQGLQTSIPIESTVKIDEYQTDLNFIQSPVPTITDNTALYLVGPAAAPLIQLVVDQATLTFTQGNATNLVNDGFDVSLKGSLGVKAPADAYISFPNSINVDWQGSKIAEISLPPICSAAGVGVPNLMTKGHLTITNQDRFTNFAEYILKNPSFTWRIYSSNVTVQAVGITFSNVNLDKQISLDVLNGLPGIVITTFDIPGETAKSLLIAADANIPSPSALGVQLDTANFNIFYQGQNIGNIAAAIPLLFPKPTSGVSGTANTLASTRGAITDQTGNTAGIAALGLLFSHFLAGVNQTLQLRGVSIATKANGNQPVSWLSNAFKRFQTNALLPGHIYQIIFAITLSDLTAKIYGPDPYVIQGGTNQTMAIFANPFRFSLHPLRAAPLITLTYQGSDTAQINLPDAPVTAGTSTSPDDKEQLILKFKDQDISSLDNGHFQSFFAKLTDTDRVDFGFKGNTSILAATHVGNIPITGIPFNVSSMLTGINSFNDAFGTQNLIVVGGRPQYVEITLNAILSNPSNLTVFTDQVSLPILYQNVYVGRVIIPKLGLIPGTNNITTTFEYMPDNPADATAQSLLRAYLQPVENTESTPQLHIPLTILGTGGGSQALTPYASLLPALQGVRAEGTIDGIGGRVVSHINVYLSIKSLTTALGGTATVAAAITFANPLPAALGFAKLAGTIYSVEDGLNAQPYASLDPTFDPTFNIGGKSSATSPIVDNIVLTRGPGIAGLVASLPLIGKNLDVKTTVSANIGSTDGGYRVPSLLYDQINIDTDYFVCAAPGVQPCLQIDAVGSLVDILKKLLSVAGGSLGDLLNNIPGVASLLGSLGNELGGVLETLLGANNGAFTDQIASALATNSTLLQGALSALSGNDGDLSKLVSALGSSASSKSVLCEVGKVLPLPLLASAGCTTTTAPATSKTAAATSAMSSAATSAVGAATSAASSVVNNATSAAASAAEPLTSAVDSAVGALTSAVGGRRDL